MNKMQFSLMFFDSRDDISIDDQYRLVIESAKFGDRHGFTRVWIPERHFTEFGSLYPNPAILHAALARETQHIRLQAGSVVLPLHHPIQIVEEWAMLDCLSGGRVGISFAPGWHPNDFILAPDKYTNRYQELDRGIKTVQKLWRGESISIKNGSGNLVEVKAYPKPIQKDLPVWMTVARNPKNFVKAGEMGANVLTHLLDQNLEQLAEKIALYRQSRLEAGYAPEAGIVTVMLHTFVGSNLKEVRQQARQPFCQFLKSNPALLEGLAKSRGYSVNTIEVSDQDLDEFLNFLYDRFVSTRGLIGTPETCLGILEELERVGANEVACLLDFGPDENLVLSNLPTLDRLKSLYQNRVNYHQNPTDRKPEQIQFIQKHNRESSTEISLSQIKNRCKIKTYGWDFYKKLEEYGFSVKPTDQNVESLWLGEGEAFGQIKLDPEVEPNSKNSHLPPCLLNACEQVISGILYLDRPLLDERLRYLSRGVKSLQIRKDIGSSVGIYVKLQPPEKTNFLEADIYIFDSFEELVVEIIGWRMQQVGQPLNVPLNFESKYKDWFYNLQWQEQSYTSEDRSKVTRKNKNWVIFTDRTGVGQNLSELLRNRGETCLVVNYGETERVDEESFSIDPAVAEQMQKLIPKIQKLVSLAECNIIHLWSLDVTPPQQITAASLQRDRLLSVGSSLHLLQALASCSEVPKVWLVTRGVQPIKLENRSLAIAQSPLWGLGRVASIEFAHLWGGAIDLDPQSSNEELAQQLFKAIVNEIPENQVAYRQGKQFVARLHKIPQLPAKKRAIKIREDSTYMITGGLGGIGFQVANWMVEKGARSLVLVGRKSSKNQHQFRPLEAAGAKVMFVQADVSDPEALELGLSKIQQSLPPLRGIIHLAGILDDAILLEENWEHFSQVVAPKIEGAWNLHSLTEKLPLDFFVLFSSASSLFGSAIGQGNYVTANTFLDYLAHYRSSLGLPALSINWGPWSEVGHAATDYGRKAHEQAAQLGINNLSIEQGLDILENLLFSKEVTQIGVVPIQWSRLFETDSFILKNPLLVDIINQERLNQSSVKPASHAILDRLAASVDSERQEILMNYLQDRVSKVLRISRTRINCNEPLNTLGLDSLMAVELRNKLQTDLGIEISIVQFVAGASISNLATTIKQRIAQNTESKTNRQIKENNWIEGEL